LAYSIIAADPRIRLLRIPRGIIGVRSMIETFTMKVFSGVST
jgi:hypothetical protein